MSVTDNKEIFDMAFEFSEIESTCLKVQVGACFHNASKGLSFILTSNRNQEGWSCKSKGKCYKAEVTGIYESCEETRKFCKSIHSEIEMIERIKAANLSREEIESGVLYVTRYMCENCTREVIKSGIKKVIYCGKVRMSEICEKMLTENGVYFEHHPEYDYEYDKS
jgi:deoxycytidylate deaminase